VRRASSNEFQSKGLVTSGFTCAVTTNMVVVSS